MKSDKKTLKLSSVVAGALFIALLVAAPSVGADLQANNDFGSDTQVRSHLIDMNQNQVNLSDATTYKFGELSYGDGKCGAGEKKGEEKCGEGKCGEGEKEVEGKSGDGDKEGEEKCGEGKCGEGEKTGEKKEAKKGDSATESSKSDESKEAKCGEGKCG